MFTLPLCCMPMTYNKSSSAPIICLFGV
jgi:hypothetical protein